MPSGVSSDKRQKRVAARARVWATRGEPGLTAMNHIAANRSRNKGSTPFTRSIPYQAHVWWDQVGGAEISIPLRRTSDFRSFCLCLVSDIEVRPCCLQDSRDANYSLAFPGVFSRSSTMRRE